MSLNNINHLDLRQQVVGNEKRLELLSDIMANGTFLPKTVVYKDIDDDFRRWVDEDLRIVSDDGKVFPTMSLFSNQRFSEYSQSWKYTDTNNNLLLNFKTITRENNPQYGKIQAGLWNIPGERFYTMKMMKVLDDNGTESLISLKMKQPVSIDFMFKLGVFTTKYSKINEFNTLMNKKFSSRQCYIRPNGHYMPMTLESISDESEYNIDDRQFYSQTYNIKIMGYIITDEDYRVDEIPLKRGIYINGVNRKIRKAEAEIIEDEDNNSITLNIDFPVGKNTCDFTVDIDFIINKITTQNIISSYLFSINDSDVQKDSDEIEINENDKFSFRIKRKDKNSPSKITLTGTLR